MVQLQYCHVPLLLIPFQPLRKAPHQDYYPASADDPTLISANAETDASITLASTNLASDNIPATAGLRTES